MITALHGLLRSKLPLEAVIDIHGISFEVMISTRTYEQLPDLNKTCQLFTHLISREDQHYLVGFHNDEDRAWFRRLIKITGIGPKAALAILSALTPSQLRSAIESQNSTLLTRVPGIGKKTAERIILELSDPRARQWMQRLTYNDEHPADTPATLPVTSIHDDIRDALSTLGYNNAEIEKSIKHLPKEGHLDSLLRQALQYLSGLKR